MERAFKYHGLGNDFVVLDRRDSRQDIDALAAQRLCDRHRGIGADGVLVLLPAEGALARMVVHNADGSVAQMCGNGLRCVVKYLVEHGPGDRPPSVRVQTDSGLRTCEVRYEAGEVSQVQVDMGRPQLTFINAPITGYDFTGTAVSLGNPHLVLFDRPLEEAARLGPTLERHALFPERTNVEWARPEGEGFRVAVWERGAGLTQACGTGACAVAAAAVKTGRAAAGRWLPVLLPGGRLEVRVEEGLARVDMRGPATFVFEAGVP